MRFPLFLMALGALAQNAPHIRDWRPDPSEAATRSKSSCAALHSLTGYEFSVMTAEDTGA